jgi:hypothetical protein
MPTNPDPITPSELLPETGPLSDVARQILRSLTSSSGGAQSHQRLLATRKLAKKLNTSVHQVHRAIGELKDRGYLYSRHGSGVYVSETAPFLRDRAPRAKALTRAKDFGGIFSASAQPMFASLRFTVNAGYDKAAKVMWNAVLDAFRRRYPFIGLEYGFDLDRAARDDDDIRFGATSDVVLTPEAFQAFGPEELGDAGLDLEGLCPGTLDLGRSPDGKALLAAPVLRCQGMLAVNDDLLGRAGLDADDIRTPADLFQMGAELGERQEGVYGFNFAGVRQYASLYGVEIRREGDRFAFDRDLMARLLADLKPHIRPHHFTIATDRCDAEFLDGHLGLFYRLWLLYPLMCERTTALRPARLPVLEGGFACEAAIVAGISPRSSNREEALLLLAFLAGREAQDLFTEHGPNWLSVRPDVLETQQASSPFPPGSMLYDFDARAYFAEVDPVIYGHSRRWNTQAAKFFTDMQGLETTLEKLSLVYDEGQGNGAEAP